MLVFLTSNIYLSLSLSIQHQFLPLAYRMAKISSIKYIVEHICVTDNNSSVLLLAEKLPDIIFMIELSRYISYWVSHAHSYLLWTFLLLLAPTCTLKIERETVFHIKSQLMFQLNMKIVLMALPQDMLDVRGRGQNYLNHRKLLLG